MNDNSYYGMIAFLEDDYDTEYLETLTVTELEQLYLNETDR